MIGIMGFKLITTATVDKLAAFEWPAIFVSFLYETANSFHIFLYRLADETYIFYRFVIRRFLMRYSKKHDAIVARSAEINK